MVVIFDDDEIFLCNNKFFAIHLMKNIRLEDLSWRTGGEESGLE
jgi:hypothetical protein